LLPDESSRVLICLFALASIFEAVLETLAFAVVIVDGRGHVHFANRAARTLFQSGTQLTSLRGLLQATAPAAAEALASAIDQAARAEWPTPTNAIPLSGPDCEPAIAHVAPLRDASQQGFAAVFVTSTRSVPAPPFDAIAALYELTPAETRVMSAIASGKNRAAAAAAMGIADSTAKTHLARVFAKTRTSEQAELTKLAMALSPPVITTDG